MDPPPGGGPGKGKQAWVRTGKDTGKKRGGRMGVGNPRGKGETSSTYTRGVCKDPNYV